MRIDVLSIPLSISTWFLKYRLSLDFFSISNSKKKSILKLDFFVEFELDFYCLCSLQKSSSNSKKKSSFEIDFFFEFEINSEIQNSKIKCRETGGSARSKQYLVITERYPSKKIPLLNSDIKESWMLNVLKKFFFY